MWQTGVHLVAIDETKPPTQQQQDEMIQVRVDSPDHLIKAQPDLLDGSREIYIDVGIPLYEASIQGDWEAAKEILDDKPELVRLSITENGETALHVAASAECSKQVEDFVENLMTYMEKEDLELRDNSSNTALCIVAASGNLKLIIMMIQKNRRLLTITGSQGMTPLHMAAMFGHHDVVRYLYDISWQLRDDGWTPQNRGWLFQICVENDMFDSALRIVQDRPEVAFNGGVLGVLARKPLAFSEKKSYINMSASNWGICPKRDPRNHDIAFQLLRIVWEDIARMPKNVIDNILRGPPDTMKQDDKPASDKEDRTLQLLRKLISDNVLNMQKIKESAATTLDDLNVPLSEFVATTSEDLDAPLSDDLSVPLSGNANTKYSSHILFVAAEMGNTRFIVELIRLYPDLIWKLNDNNQSIFHTAAEHRELGIYNLLYEIGSKKEQITLLKDTNDNNMLHLIGKCAKKKRHEDVSGAAFEMQRELLWFREVEKVIPRTYREERNNDGLTPHELFTKEHKDLVKQGEEWMKGTASQCMVVAALIATIVFAAAFTVPGGYNQDDGIPIYYQKVTFMIFVVADAISLFSSSASILMFLSILTSRYAEHDFLESIPKKLLLGLATLFLSITTMMVAFSVSFFVLYHKDLQWVPLLVALFATMPVLLFATLQFPLLRDVFRSTYGSRYLFRPKKRSLYKKRALPFISRCTSKIMKLL